MRPLATVSLAALAMALAWAGPARAQSLTPPELRTRVEAAYPPEALRDRLAATVGLEIVVDEGGRVVDARVTSPAGHGFDEAALEAVRRFVFEPARRDGVPTRATIALGYEFHPPPVPEAAQPAPAAPPPPMATQQSSDQSTLVLGARPREVEVTAPGPTASSQSSTGRDELLLLPRYRAEDMLDVVPGLFSVQHAGGGKAQQDFARGFNLDHGTDMAFFVDGVPVNAVSHAHGQGYSDLHFLIPETVERIDSRMGPYATDVGDFGTAGNVTFRMADHVGESLARTEWAPSTGHERLVVVESPDLGPRWRMAVAAEAFKEDGPFIHPEGYDRLNAFAKVTRVLDERSELSFMLQAYGGSWNMSGVLPAHAVCGEGDGTPVPPEYAGSRCISRWDSVDPTQGGAAQRFAGVAEYRREMDAHWDLDATAYVVRSNLQLFPNDGIAAPFQPDGVAYGSQVEQDDTRTTTGATLRLTRRTAIAGMPLRTTMGLQVRNDDIEAQLHRTQGRQRLDGLPADPATGRVPIPGPIYDGRIDETEAAAYVEEEARPAPWLRFVLGARLDHVDAAVNNESPTAVDKASGYVSAGQLSPKATAVVTPVREWDLFANYGRGFHTNDARTLVEGAATTLIVPARGYEVGTTVRPVRGLSLSATGFLIDLDSELTIDGDTASTSPSGATRRYGLELTGHWAFDRRFYAEIAFTAAHSRYTDAADVAANTVYLPDAPVRTFSATLGARQPVGPVTLLGSASVRAMSDRYGDSGPAPLVETGWTVVNLGAGARWRFLELGLDVFNVADTAWREGQFEVAARLPKQPVPSPAQAASWPAGISFTPGLPRTAMMHATLYW